MTNKEVSEKISEDLDINLSDSIEEKEIIEMIALRVEQLLKGDPDLLMSYLYRLDVEEKKINFALESSLSPVHITFANLIWDRQKQRILTKKKYKQDPIKGWEL